MTTMLPRLEILQPAAVFDPAALFSDPIREIWLEIGFGGGEHLAAQAARHPTALMIGCEPFLNGVGSALRHIEDGDLKNVRLHADDA
ncbi:MAG: tRNA (guanosine(46)-N7)-methyltransferase TrmB, partial [Rhodospirillales bacterium]|nr:tRNA (guanosine(46)-N7)-methyltransferase TrmB [Rhodospirillales bacterium]